jgi:hypothetical protein
MLLEEPAGGMPAEISGPFAKYKPNDAGGYKLELLIAPSEEHPSLPEAVATRCILASIVFFIEQADQRFYNSTLGSGAYSNTRLQGY